MKDKLPGTGDLQTDSCPLPALPCLPAPPACPGIFTGSSLNILHPRHLSLAAQCSRLIQPGSPTLSSWSLVCNIDIRCVHGNTLMPPPWHLLGAAPGSCSLTCWDPLGLKVTSLTNWRRKNFPALPNVLSSANKPPLPTTLGWKEELSNTICNMKAWRSKLLLICANNSLGNFREVFVSISAVLTLCL